MGEEIVTVSAGGKTWTAFESVSVAAHFRHAARSFHLEIAAEPGPEVTAWSFKAGTEVQIFFNGDLACHGFVDRYQPKIAGHKRAGATVSGRSRSQDFIDSSAVHDTGEFKNKTVAEIAQALDKFNVGILTDQQLPKVPVYRITPGETAYRVAEKLCRQAGVWASGQADGSILITVAGKGRNTPIIEGDNLLSGEADHNWANRHRDVIVRGQRPVGHGVQAMEIEATSHDPELTRPRAVVVPQDDDTDQQRAKERATHRRDSEVANSLKAHATMQGFHDAADMLWTPGNLVFFESPFLDVAQDMAIDGATFTQSRRAGSRTVLNLVDPAALGAKGRKGGKANSAWANSAGDD